MNMFLLGLATGMWICTGALWIIRMALKHAVDAEPKKPPERPEPDTITITAP